MRPFFLLAALAALLSGCSGQATARLSSTLRPGQQLELAAQAEASVSW